MVKHWMLGIFLAAVLVEAAAADYTFPGNVRSTGSLTGGTKVTTTGPVQAGTYTQFGASTTANLPTPAGYAWIWDSTTGSVKLWNLSSWITLTAAAGLTDPVTVAHGGTGVATLAANGVLYGNGTGTALVTAQGAANSVLTANAGAPVFSASPTLAGLGIGAAPTSLLDVRGAASGYAVSVAPAASGSSSGWTGLTMGAISAASGEGERISMTGLSSGGNLYDLARVSSIVISRNMTDLEGALAFYTHTSANANPTERMRIDNSGQVGIGTASPGALLDVNGTIRGVTLNATGLTASLPVWTDGSKNLVSKTATAAFDALSPMTASGDIIYGGTAGTGTRLSKGTDGKVLTLASGLPSWATPAAGVAVGDSPTWAGIHTFTPSSQSANTLTVNQSGATYAGLRVATVHGHGIQIAKTGDGTSVDGTAALSISQTGSDTDTTALLDFTRSGSGSGPFIRATNGSTKFELSLTGGILAAALASAGFLSTDGSGNFVVNGSSPLTIETDTLNSVTGRGASTANGITVGSVTSNSGSLALIGGSATVITKADNGFTAATAAGSALFGVDASKDVTTYSHLIGSGDSRGQATITTGNTTVAVSFTNAFASTPTSVVVTPLSDPGVGERVWVSGIGTGGFTINVSTALGGNTTFCWFAIQ